ncbi:MAG: hypothetical protein COS08_02560 [Euryarchaeota archaeon CG01_land_8_20_14_3_00_38_12]|nr:MAG: hypothetical protein COS08_02560 [Euryarchaeota archaeon CG01_land_8_20_14_3_00_38_12]PJB20890.1 MAG: hypothetical protein CO114_08285 [Euryarchaeota archaeon CG_4_9_14_3_um_filter_38_12]
MSRPKQIEEGKVIAIRLSKSTIDKIDARIQASHKNRSIIIREALEKNVASAENYSSIAETMTSLMREIHLLRDDLAKYSGIKKTSDSANVIFGNDYYEWLARKGMADTPKARIKWYRKLLHKQRQQ